MENKKTWEKENVEVQTEDREDNEAVGVGFDDENANDAGLSDTNRTHDEDDRESGECVVAGMSTRQRAGILILGIILIALLVWLITWAYGITRGGDRAERIHDSENSDSETTETDNVTTPENPGINGQWIFVPTQPGTIPSGSGNNGNSGGNNTDIGNQGGNIGDNNQTSDTDGGNGGEGGSEENTGNDQNGGNGNDGQNNGHNGSNAPSDYSGETKIRISTVNDDTGVVTITIDGSSISVPLQTTYFNGRVTKSGVAQGKLFGFNSGVTVMLFYPQEEGFHTAEVNAFMNRTSESLTVLVDINGDGSKLLIKINGMKSLF